MHLIASTSVDHYRTLDTSHQNERILALLRETEDEYCIADLAEALQWEKSTVSARLNELRNAGRLEYAGKKPSRKTGITSMHWKIKLQEQIPF